MPATLLSGSDTLGGYPQRMKAKFSISQEEFQARKKARIEELRKPARTLELPVWHLGCRMC